MWEYEYHLSGRVSEHIVSQGVVLPTFLVVDNLAVVIFEHLRVGNTGVSDIASHVGICATLVGNDFEEGGTS